MNIIKDENNKFCIWNSDCLSVLKTIDDNSIDSVVTDPPYELGFMNKKWDNTGVAYNIEVWQECLRVLKPGAHLLAFGGTRTYHRMACAIEDAGFEIRDSIHWIYGSGFPKSLNISKAIDKMNGVEFSSEPASGVGFMNSSDNGYNNTLNKLIRTGESTEEAKIWQGWGSALKPAHEPIIVARKPFKTSIMVNVLQYGTGAINIDECRVDGNTEEKRWPPNIVHDGSDEVESLFPDAGGGFSRRPKGRNLYSKGLDKITGQVVGYGDKGKASRFFPSLGYEDIDEASFLYCPKANKNERNIGLDHIEPIFSPTMKDGVGAKPHNPETATLKNNFHPTVKPLKLMRWLVRLVTPPNGIVLDPFAGSGTTIVAALLEGKNGWGCEITEDYMQIIQGRINWAIDQI